MENEAAIEGAGRIVIVEDDRVTARDLQESLETCGYAVIGVVSDGKEAIDLATAKQPDLVLMDILLEGDLDGIEVAGELRHRLDVPIVYLTAYSREELIERAKLTEPFAFLLKPFRKEHLRATIEMALRQHRLTKRTRENFERELAEKSVELARAVENLETEIQWRKSIQVALLKEQARYLSLVESAPLGIVTYSHEGDITGANPAFWNLIGIKAASRATVFNLRDTPTVRDLGLIQDFDKCLTTRDPVTGEHCFVSREGREVHVRVHFAPLRDRDGRIAGVQAIFDDITERMRARQEVLASERKFRSLFESAPVGIGIAQHGRYQYGNPAFVKILGYDVPQEIIGLPLGSVCIPQYRERLRRTSRDILEGEPASRSYEVTGVKKTGATFDAILWLTSFEYLGLPAVLVFLTDVSEEKKLRSQLLQAQKLDAIGTLAAGIAHDFNNLLQAIFGYAELALFKTKQDQVGYREFQVIMEAARRAGELTQGLLTFSRQVPGKLRPVDLNREIEDMARLLDRTLPKMITTELRLAQDLKIIDADPVQLQQVLMNLALNARDAMPAGGKLVISTENVHLMSRDSKVHTGLRPGEYVLLSICDNGCGMDRETLHRIFEPFFSTKEKGKGTGLGLSTVYGIVKSHGGDITCYSEPGQGTSFQVYLPCVTLEAKKEESTEIGQILGGQETLLLIDDEEYLRNLGEEILTRFGYSVITAPSAREGLRLYEENRDRIALVLLDVIMPEMSGKECLREILKIDPLAKVILVSGYANASSLESDDYRRARGFVRKPYESRRLLELVRSVLDEPELIEEND